MYGLRSPSLDHWIRVGSEEDRSGCEYAPKPDLSGFSRIQAASSSGQPYYPTYLLAPYRLACVAGGMFVAFVWTFFPFPLTARSQLRQDLGVSLYLLANYYSIVHTTSGQRISGTEGNMESKKSPGRKLQKARRNVYVKELALLAGLRQHSAFTAWEPTFGGKFPKQQYDTIIQEVEKYGVATLLCAGPH